MDRLPVGGRPTGSTVSCLGWCLYQAMCPVVANRSDVHTVGIVGVGTGRCERDSPSVRRQRRHIFQAGVRGERQDLQFRVVRLPTQELYRGQQSDPHRPADMTAAAAEPFGAKALIETDVMASGVGVTPSGECEVIRLPRFTGFRLDDVRLRLVNRHRIKPTVASAWQGLDVCGLIWIVAECLSGAWPPPLGDCCRSPALSRWTTPARESRPG